MSHDAPRPNVRGDCCPSSTGQAHRRGRRSWPTLSCQRRPAQADSPVHGPANICPNPQSVGGADSPASRSGALAARPARPVKRVATPSKSRPRRQCPDPSCDHHHRWLAVIPTSCSGAWHARWRTAGARATAIHEPAAEVRRTHLRHGRSPCWGSSREGQPDPTRPADERRRCACRPRARR